MPSCAASAASPKRGWPSSWGCRARAVSKWERAESAPDMGNLIALADLYEVTLDELLRVSPEVADDVRFESQERAESVETEAAAAAEAALAAAARAEAAAATAAEAPEAPKVVVEVSAPAIGHRVRAMARVCFPTVRRHRRRAGCLPSWLLPTGFHSASVFGAHCAATDAPNRKIRCSRFPYPLLCAVIFLLAGFCFGWWHPAWVIFLTLPFYYWVVNTLEADPSYQAWLAERQDVAAKSDSSSEGGAR